MIRTKRFLSVLTAVSATAVLLAGCGTPQLVEPANQAASPTASWMAPDAKKQPSLLYVANDGTQSVTVYTYLDGSGLILVGTLTGFSKPAGMCTDRTGNVWITDYAARKVYEYAHGGTAPIFTIHEDGSSQPNACAVDLNTGDLAVANQFPNAHYAEQGNVKIYHPGSHTGTKYHLGYMHVAFLAFDDHDNLYIDGLPTYYGYGNGPLVVIPSGTRQVNNLTINGGNLYGPSAVQWINPTLLVGDNRNNSAFAYKLFISGSVATIVGKLHFSDTRQSYGFSRRADKVAVPDWTGNAVRIYELSDGSLTATLTDAISKPYSAVVSQP